MKLRLNKALAQAGIASRRAADRLIESGSVVVNGQVVTELGTQIDPAIDAVKVNGKRIPTRPTAHVYYMLNKPDGYVTTLSDPEGRPTVKDLLPTGQRRLFPVGRLDFHSEGLLILTNDGDLSRNLMHPSQGVPKVYSTKVKGSPTEVALVRLKKGILLDGKQTAPARVRFEKRGANSWLRITIHEGRKHQIRKMFEAIGHRVLRLKRIGYAGIDLKELPSGDVRALTEAELSKLRGAVKKG
jgi:23S rRNA pseudouridine2605 synthase